MTTRCDQTDLFVDECGHCNGAAERFAASIGNNGFIPIAYEGSYREASFSGQCGADCGRRILESDQIVLAYTGGTGGTDDQWCHVECTRSPNGGLV